MIAGPDVEGLRMKVIGYIRVSTDEQAQGGVSLEAQRAKLEQYAELYDLDLVDIVVDAGVSAKNLHREGLKAALKKYFGTKYALLSVAEKVDTSSAAGRMILNIMATVSQWEREVIGERTSAALQHKIAQGQHVGSPALGFRMTEGQLEEHQAELAVVDRIQELRAGGLTLQAIADVLNSESIPTKRGGKWHPSTITYILSRKAA